MFLLILLELINSILMIFIPTLGHTEPLHTWKQPEYHPNRPKTNITNICLEKRQKDPGSAIARSPGEGIWTLRPLNSEGIGRNSGVMLMSNQR